MKYIHRQLESSEPSFDKESDVMRWVQRANNLLTIGKQFLETGCDNLYREASVESEELVSGADYHLHRGYYCPSPVRDLLVGNCHRGKVLKRPNARSRISHRYLYGEDGLCIIDRYWKTETRKGYSSEYLLRSGESVVGISLDSSRRIERLSEEIYKNNKILEYFLVSCNGDNNAYRFSQGECETYYYDNEGIIECELQDISFGHCPTLRNRKYRFVRKGGYLDSYVNLSSPNITYAISIKRLAMPPYFVR